MRKNSLGRKLTLCGGRWGKGEWEMGDTGVGDGRRYPLSTPSTISSIVFTHRTQELLVPSLHSASSW